jgi:FAD/FMN-containing dehydrogenase
MERYPSWGRSIRSNPAAVVELRWRDAFPRLDEFPAPFLPRGCGRSYGDSCLNNGGTLLDATPMSHLIRFDRDRGVVECEAGVTISELLKVIVPAGWFIAVSPGTKFVTLGGSIANDVHGKNHHRAGTFGRHVLSFTLHRSDGTSLRCSAAENGELFAATIGGLGLTGVITTVELQLKRITSTDIASDQIVFASLDEWDELSRASDQTFEYTVAWFDSNRSPTRGIFFRGNHAEGGRSAGVSGAVRLPLRPFSIFLGSAAMRAFNEAYFRANAWREGVRRVGFDPFFYPLDAIANWNALYGRSGLVQYQCVIPAGVGLAPVRELLARVTRVPSFLTVLKRFGSLTSPGMMSFPKEGVTLALDFPAANRDLLPMLDDLDAIVADCGGAVYPAKDARMSPKSFARFFPQWREFRRYIDPRFSSSFWQRVTYSLG